MTGFILIIFCFFPFTLVNPFRPRLAPFGRYIEASDLGPVNHYSQIKRILGPALNGYRRLLTNASNPMIYPTDYGADPTGVQDSTDAFGKAMDVALTRGKPNAVKYMCSYTLANGEKDLGGVTINLAGGDYMISRPIIIPINVGNIRIIDGTLRASDTFPSYGYLIQLGNNTLCSAENNNQGTCNENIGFEYLMLDSSHICSGGILIESTTQVTIGPQMLFIGFNVGGITMIKGHGTQIFEAWLGEYFYGDSHRSDAKSTGIQLFGYDSYILDTIVFSSKIGVDIYSAIGSVLDGVHTWNGNGAIGIYIRSRNIRLTNIYSHHTKIVIKFHPLELITILNSYFFAGATVELESVPNKNNTINCLIIKNNIIDGQNYSYQFPLLNTTNGVFTTLIDTQIYDNEKDNEVNKDMIIRSTKGRLKLYQQNSTEWMFNFTDLLVFNSIDITWIDYSLQIEQNGNSNQFVMHGITKIDGLIVVIGTSEAISGIIYCNVDQSNYSY